MDKKALAHWHNAARRVFKATRDDQDLTQEELGKRIGWTREQVSAFEKGRRKLSIGEAILLSQALKMNPETMLSRILNWGGR